MTSRKVRLNVIVNDDGTLVGTCTPDVQGDQRGGVRSRIVAGPGQKVREIELDVDASIVERGDIEALHARVREHLSRSAATGSAL